MRLPALVAMAFLLASCQSAPAGTAVSPTLTPGALISSQASPSATPVPPSNQTGAGAFGSCRLPVAVNNISGGTPAGWLDLPGGTVTADPSSVGVSPGSTIAWDPAVGRWLNTEPARISPDGATYFDGNDGRFRTVDARTGATVKVLTAPDTDFVRVVAYTAGGVYMTKFGLNAPPGLWKVDPATGRFSQVSKAQGAWSVVDDRYAWGTDLNSAVEIIDLKTGASRQVFRSRHEFTDLAGVTGSGAFLFEGDAGLPTNWASLIQLDGSALAVPIPDGLRGKTTLSYFKVGPAITIVGNGMGLAAYDPDHGLKVLATAPDVYKVLGPCAAG